MRDEIRTHELVGDRVIKVVALHDKQEGHWTFIGNDAETGVVVAFGEVPRIAAELEQRLSAGPLLYPVEEFQFFKSFPVRIMQHIDPLGRSTN